MADLKKPLPAPTHIVPPPAAPHEIDWSPSTLGGELPRPTAQPVVEPGDSNLPRAFGDHELLQEVARGGMGVVFRARHQRLDRIVALKMILHGTLASPQLVQRFYQEARAAASLDHPGIVPIHEIGQVDGQHYFTMAFVEGQSLAALVRQRGALPPAEAVSLMHVLVAAVSHAHQHGIVHRDLKPDNVLLDRDGRPRITDFGLAKLRSGDANLTGAGQILGTPAFMAPEQAIGEQSSIGPAADIYSLGGILYCLLTGRPPFLGSNLTEVLFSVVQSPPVPLRSLNPDIPADLEAICLRCLEKQPRKRYDSAQQLAAALAELGYPSPSVVAGGMSARTVAPSSSATVVNSTPKAAPPPPKARPVLPLAVAGTVVLAGAAAVMLWQPWVPREAGGTTPPDDPTPSAVISGGKNERPIKILAQSSVAAAKPSLAWLAEMEKEGRRDFGLKVGLVGASANDQGVYRLREGQIIRLSVEVEKPAYIGIWTVDPRGDVMQLYPAAGEEMPLLDAGKPHLLPRQSEDDVEVTPGTGLERILVVASSQKWSLAQGERDGPHMLFRTSKHREQLESSLRGLRRVPKLSQQLIPFQVGAK